MATYYMRADGTAANKAAATSDSAASTAMSIVTHNLQTFSAGDTIVVSDAGGVYRGQIWVPSSGSSGSPITYQANDGGSPVIKSSKDVTTASYSWTASGSGTNEYYCRTSGGSNPSLSTTDAVFMDDTFLDEGDSIGTLDDHEWGYGDNDSLGYNTLYVRDDSGDPDTSGVQIEIAQNGCFAIVSQNYITVDGLEFRQARGTSFEGGLRAYGDNIIIQNCEAHWCQAHGIKIGGDNSTITNCTASYNGAHNICAGGSAGTHLTGATLSYNTTHHARVTDYSGVYPFSGYGLKFIYVDDSFIYGNVTYENYFQGIDLDYGCLRCEVYENKVYGNEYQGVAVEINSSDCKVYRNLIYNNGATTLQAIGQYEISVYENCDNTEIFHNVVYKTRDAGNNNNLIWVGTYSAASTGTLIYSNTLAGNGYSVNGILVTDLTSPEGTKIKNNIITGTTGPCLVISGTSYTGFESDYNCYRRSDLDADVISRGGTLYTIAEHNSSFSQDGNSMNSDPGFTNAGGDDYSLASNSPCIGAGVNLGSEYDDAIMPGSTWPDDITTGDQDSV